MDNCKVLCMHGYGTSAEFMKFQMATWLEKFPKTKFIFLDGMLPFDSRWTKNPDIINFHKDSRKKVFDNTAGKWTIDKVYVPEGNQTHAHPERAEFQRMVDVIVQHQGVDAIFGFSQGGVIVEGFLSCMEMGFFDDVLKKEYKPYFSIIMCPPDSFLTPVQLQIPVFLLMGSLDQITPISFIILTRFRNSQHTFFEGGHRPPILSSRLYRLVQEFATKSIKNRQQYLKITEGLKQRL